MSEAKKLEIPVNEHQPAYQAAVDAQNQLSAAMREWFSGLLLSQKAYVVMNQDHDYLGEDTWYCGHVTELVDDGDGFPVKGGEVSLYDDLFWERNQTKHTADILDDAFSEWLDSKGLRPAFNGDLEKYKEERNNLCAEFCADIENALGAHAAVARDMLNNNIKLGIFDW